MLTRDECRRYFADCGLTYGTLDDGDIASLFAMLSAKMRKCRKNPTGSYHETWRMSKRVRIDHDTHGRIVGAYLKCIPYPGGMRECISFNRDGFIGFCGDFDDRNAEPILMTFIKWCRLISGDGE